MCVYLLFSSDTNGLLLLSSVLRFDARRVDMDYDFLFHAMNVNIFGLLIFKE